MLMSGCKAADSYGSMLVEELFKAKPYIANLETVKSILKQFFVDGASNLLLSPLPRPPQAALTNNHDPPSVPHHQLKRSSRIRPGHVLLLTPSPMCAARSRSNHYITQPWRPDCDPQSGRVRGRLDRSSPPPRCNSRAPLSQPAPCATMTATELPRSSSRSRKLR